jgi:RNA polymerase sigma-70 factor, ECF subfamily
LQEILLQIWRSVPRFQGKAKASTWIYKVALNTALTWQRGERRHRRAHMASADAPAVPNLHTSPNRTHEKQEFLDWLYREIRALPEVDSALVLLYLDGVNYREMSEILGLSESNVGVKLNRLKKRLAEVMKGAGHGS